MSTGYKDAGVDVEAGDQLVEWLQKPGAQQSPHKEKIVSGIGGFAALFRANFSHMKSPCLVSSTDGVGTKVKLAAQFNKYSGVGQDLVAMCVNDLACVGAQPLFFLDYYATGKLDLKAAQDFLSGVRKACHDSDCALIGGETAEMPGVYHSNDFDCAGFVVGVVDEAEALGPAKVQEGDVLLAVASSGFHSNGYSLLRKVFADDLEKWAEQLLIPTHLYPKLVLALKKEIGENLHAVANVTGGGFDNLPRVIQKNQGLELKAYEIPPAFMEVKKRAKMEYADLFKTLNCGVGMVLMMNPAALETAKKCVIANGFKCFEMGSVVKGNNDWTIDYSAVKKLNGGDV